MRDTLNLRGSQALASSLSRCSCSRRTLASISSTALANTSTSSNRRHAADPCFIIARQSIRRQCTTLPCSLLAASGRTWYQRSRLRSTASGGVVGDGISSQRSMPLAAAGASPAGESAAGTGWHWLLLMITIRRSIFSASSAYLSSRPSSRMSSPACLKVSSAASAPLRTPFQASRSAGSWQCTDCSAASKSNSRAHASHFLRSLVDIGTRCCPLQGRAIDDESSVQACLAPVNTLSDRGGERGEIGSKGELGARC